MVRAGIVGCGNIGKVHAEILQSMKQVQIQAFVDADMQSALKYAKIYGTDHTSCYDSLSEMLKKEDIEVLHICTPHHLHVQMAKEAFEHNVHVFMEKPPAISEEEFISLKKAKQEFGKELGICFQNRYNETTEKASEILKSGILGKVKGARAFVTWNRQEEYYGKSSWHGRWSTEGGGVLINQAIHTLDLLTYFFGKPEQVEASMQNHHLKQVIEVEDTMEAYMTFSFGGVCFYATNAYAEDAPVLLEIVCENGKIRMEGDCLEITGDTGVKRAYDFTNEQRRGDRKYWGNSHRICIQDFYDSLAEGKDYRNNLESVEHTFDLVMKMYRSCRSKNNAGGEWR